MPLQEHSIGSFVHLACTWEVLARKAGNVGPGREYSDLTVHDFLQSAAAIAPIMDEAPRQPVGVTVLRAVEATRQVAAGNVNLGIILLLAPLANVPLEVPLSVDRMSRLLLQLTLADSRLVFAAIRLASPAGLGEAPREDVRAEPTRALREVMALAQHRDLIAEQYATGFKQVLEWATPELIGRIQKHNNVERGIVETQLWMLAHRPDSHIARKRGTQEATEVQDAASRILGLGGLETPVGRQAFLDFDTWLRADRHARNPGTTADLLAACLFVVLRDGVISSTTPFVWNDHPFKN